MQVPIVAEAQRERGARSREGQRSVTPIILLPGLDGTAKLFEPFIAAAPSRFSVTPVALPCEKLTYEELADSVASTVPDGPVVVIAESFSGPLAIALAERHPIAAFVFCNRPRAVKYFRAAGAKLFWNNSAVRERHAQPGAPPIATLSRRFAFRRFVTRVWMRRS